MTTKINMNAVADVISHATKGELQQYAEKQNFEFDVSGITDPWTDEVSPVYVLELAQGATAGLVNPWLGIRGSQELNVLDISPTWNTDGQDAITSAGVGKFDANVAAGTVDLTNQKITIGQEYFQIKINPYALDNTVYGLETRGNLDPTLAAAAQILESAERHARNQVAGNFFTGFGAAALANGLNNVTFAEQGTGAAITEATLLARLQELNDALVISKSANRQDNVILLKPEHYQFYINILVDGKYPDFINNQQLAGRNETLSTIKFLYNPALTVITDSTYTGEPKLFQLDKVYFGTTELSANERPELWYSKDNNAYYLRSVIYGGVQSVDTSDFFTPDVTA